MPLDDSVLQDPTIIRALFVAKGALAATTVKARDKPGANRQQAKSANAGKKWEAADKETLRELHRAGTAIRHIALQLGRSDGGIIGQLVKEGLLTDRDAGLAVIKRQDAALANA
jgi:hypothetical protein